MFIRDQFMTHTQLSKINQSNRVGKLSDQYYCPNQFGEKLLQLCHNNNKQYCNIYEMCEKALYINNYNEIWDYIVHNYSINQGIQLLKNLGYKKQIYSRFPNQFKYGIMTIGG